VYRQSFERQGRSLWRCHRFRLDKEAKDGSDAELGFDFDATAKQLGDFWVSSYFVQLTSTDKQA
jgi:uncharacterized NAD(P)/FAD-binding protein YdhS